MLQHLRALFLTLILFICFILIHIVGGVVGSLTPGGVPTEVEARASIGK